MIALIASVGLILYLLVPGIVFKGLFSLFIPLDKFHRTRGEELTFGAFASLLPLVLTFFVVVSVGWLGNHPFFFPDTSVQRASDDQTAFSSLYSETFFSQHQQEFWGASSRIVYRQARILVWLYSFTGLEALLFGWLGKNFGRFHQFKPYGFVASKFLLPNISSWYVLLTSFMWPPSPERKVMADLLTSDDHLYRGQIVGHEVDTEGKLRGVLISDALRFDRRTYLKDKDSGKPANPHDYWKKIPGKNLFIFADKLSTLNLSYQPPPSTIPEILKEILRKLNIEAQVSVESPQPPAARA
ncbi:MAG TPA: hypothetical protein VNH65_13945 [Candidatus Acidoferrum sp.]|nr:hypothetical protein [Candidatus Acidoferrum sp.]